MAPIEISEVSTSVDYSQDARAFRVDSVLGPDVLLLDGFTGEEAISRPFHFELDLLSTNLEITADSLLRTAMTISLRVDEETDRIIHGIVRRFAYQGTERDLARYRVEIVPWLWFLSLSRDSVVHQEETVPAIVEKVFQEFGYSDYTLRLAGSYPPRPYCVQYRESHLDFVSRLLEEEGIHYHFEHEEGKHTLVLTDRNSGSRAGAGIEEISYATTSDRVEQRIDRLEWEETVHPGRIALRDYDYLQPNTDLTTSLGSESEEVYDHPGRYTQRDDGERRARLRLERQEVERSIVRGSGGAASLIPGHHFSLVDHSLARANARYLVTSVRHLASGGGYLAGSLVESRYENSFTAIPHDLPYRPERCTPVPVIRGAQTAVVVGPSGEEVWVDAHGRVKIQFHWDRLGAHDDGSSCWVRVATPWGGRGYGSISIPRIGNEVVVTFEEGDPDRPLILASVYNADQTPPTGLPDAGIQMGMISRSSPGGGGANQISMTDTKGSEQITIHAQHDMTTTVLNDQTNTIHNDRTTTISNNDEETVEVDQTIEVGGNQKLTVKADADWTVENSRVTAIGVDDELDVGGNLEFIIAGNFDTGIGGDEWVEVGGASSIGIGGASEVTVDGARKLTVGGDYTVTGEGKVDISAGTELALSAGTKITLTVGGSTIEIAAAGITVKSAAMITLQGATIKLN